MAAMLALMIIALVELGEAEVASDSGAGPIPNQASPIDPIEPSHEVFVVRPKQRFDRETRRR